MNIRMGYELIYSGPCRVAASRGKKAQAVRCKRETCKYQQIHDICLDESGEKRCILSKIVADRQNVIGTHNNSFHNHDITNELIDAVQSSHTRFIPDGIKYLIENLAVAGQATDNVIFKHALTTYFATNENFDRDDEGANEAALFPPWTSQEDAVAP